MTNPPTVSYADPSGTGAPSRSRTSSGRHSPGTVQMPSGAGPAGGPGPVVLVADLADDLLDRRPRG